MERTMAEQFDALNHRIVACRQCPRLVEWREKVATEKRKSFAGDDYWGQAVPNFGDPEANRLIVGLAPAAHGANRTGRMFTGDRSGDWLYAALYRAGIANQPTSVHGDDGLRLNGVMITAVCHCVPPDNKPSLDEISNCRTFLLELLSMRSWQSILCLGSLSWNQTLSALGVRPVPKFGHGSVFKSDSVPRIVGSYHPSQQNTFTGRLTEPMLDSAIAAFLQE